MAKAAGRIQQSITYVFSKPLPNTYPLRHYAYADQHQKHVLDLVRKVNTLITVMNNLYRFLTLNVTLRAMAKNATAKNNPPRCLNVLLKHPDIHIVDETEQTIEHVNDYVITSNLSLGIDTYLYDDAEVITQALDAIEAHAEGWDLMSVRANIVRE